MRTPKTRPPLPYTLYPLLSLFFFFFNDPAPPELFPFPLHDPLPIFVPSVPDLDTNALKPRRAELRQEVAKLNRLLHQTNAILTTLDNRLTPDTSPTCNMDHSSSVG